jgi:hypothetical protein
VLSYNLVWVDEFLHTTPLAFTRAREESDANECNNFIVSYINFVRH